MAVDVADSTLIPWLAPEMVPGLLIVRFGKPRPTSQAPCCAPVIVAAQVTDCATATSIKEPLVVRHTKSIRVLLSTMLNPAEDKPPVADTTPASVWPAITEFAALMMTLILLLAAKFAEPPTPKLL